MLHIPRRYPNEHFDGVTIYSFAFRDGPQPADIVVDLRGIMPKNLIDWHYLGTHEYAKNIVKERYMPLLRSFADVALTYENFPISIAFGCAYGRQRSVASAEVLGEMLKEYGIPVRIIHRDIDHEYGAGE